MTMKQSDPWKYHEVIRRYDRDALKTIAADLGISITTIKEWKRRYRADPERPPPVLGGARPHYHGVTPAEREAIQAGKRGGMSVRELMRQFERCHTTVEETCRGINDQRRRKK